MLSKLVFIFGTISNTIIVERLPVVLKDYRL